MAKAKCYTPQLRRDLISRLYHRAKAERIPMTVLTNRLVETALGLVENDSSGSSADKLKR